MLRRFALAGLISLAFCELAQAGYVGNYTRWKGLDDSGRLFYVFGLIDRMVNDNVAGEEAWITARRTGYDNCIGDMKLKGDMLAEAVTQHYLSHPRDWSIAPAIVLEHVLGNVCIDFINTERAKFSLHPWKARSGSVLGD